MRANCKKEFASLLLLGVLMVGNLNCTKIKFDSASGAQPVAKNGGDGYSGKLFVLLRQDGACPDGKLAEAAINVTADKTFLLARKDCRDLTPEVEIPPQDIRYDEASGTLVYMEVSYELAASSAPDDADQTQPVARKALCEYPVWEGPVNSPQSSECHPWQRETFTRDSGTAYIFEIYNASNNTHGWVPESLGYPGDRFVTHMFVDVAHSHAPNSIHLLLSSHETVQWVIRGNTAAVRSVHVDGVQCASVTGVPADKVTISTDEQGKDGPTIDELGRTFGIKKSQSFYEGTCLAGRAFKAD